MFKWITQLFAARSRAPRPQTIVLPECRDDPYSPVYKLESPTHHWGDFGDILVAGMTAHLPRSNGILQLERAGPFVPPITLPGISDIVVTDSFRKKLEASGLTGFTFRQVVKARIVHLDWQNWDLATDDPPEDPDVCEPEDYILNKPHSPETAQQVGEVWEMCLEECAAVERVNNDKHIFGVDIYLILSSWDGRDFFRAKGVGYNYTSKRARAWLESNAREWVQFESPLIR